MSRWFSAVPVLLGAALLAGCIGGGNRAADAGCNAEAVQDGVGQTATPSLQDELRRRSGAERLRVLRPGAIMTLEFDEQRLNLHVDQRTRIKSLNCG